MRMRVAGSMALILSVLAAAQRGAYGYSNFAVAVTSYDPGVGANSFYTDASAALGAPANLTAGDGTGGAVPVVPVYPTWMDAASNPQLVWLGYGGQITLQFDHPVTHDPANPYGRDLIVFGNAFFKAQSSWTNGDPNLSHLSTSLASLVHAQGGVLGVSPDNATWTEFSDTIQADGFAPTLGYVYDPVHPDASLRAGNLWWGAATNPTVPLDPNDPNLALASLAGKSVAQVAQAYGIMAGGTAVDISTLGVSSVSYVRIRNKYTSDNYPAPKVDAVAIVTPTQWNRPVSGGTINYSDKVNWSSQVVPDPRTPAAYFLGTISTPTTVNIDQPVTIALLKFDSLQGYTLSGTNSITLAPQMSGALPVAPGITVLSGSQVVQVPVVLGGATTVTVAAHSQLTLSGGIGGTGKLILLSGGAVVLGGTNTYGGGTEVDGGVLTFSTAGARPSGDVLTLGKSGSPAVGGIVVAGGEGANLDTYRSALAASFTRVGGNWVWTNGGSIGTNAATLGANEGIGYLTGAQYVALHPSISGIAAGDIVLKYTYLGDTTLKGYIDANDFAQLDAAWLKHIYNGGEGDPKAHWINGDFNYDGRIDGTDFAILDAAYAQQVGGLANDPFYGGNLAVLGPGYAEVVAGQLAAYGAVPEPGSLGILGVGVIGMLGSRRRTWRSFRDVPV